MGFSVQNVCGFLIRGRLMAPEEMRAMAQRWEKSAGKEAADLNAFLKWLVASGYVTEYQAGLLGQGHADNFFLNQYKILERIGRGRMAGVFKAVHTLGQVVAIKVLPPSRAKSPALLARFEREARLAMRLKHPNVVRAFQLGEANGVHYLVMEHLEGETLEELLRRKKTLPPAEACRLAHQALLGLQYIHEQGMVHRDIKPANLFLESVRGTSAARDRIAPTGVSDPTDCVVKILDIGLARELFEEDEPKPSTAPGQLELTAEGVLLGTPDYLAPEQARDARRSDIRADIYSLGCVLYQMLVGQTPFPDRNLFNQIVRHATEPPKPLRSFNPAIPEGLEQMVGWMMAKKPEERYPTPARAAKALEMFLLVGNQAPVAEEAPQLRRYLTWLETEQQTPGAEDATVISAPPRTTPAPAVPRAAPVQAAPEVRPARPVPRPAPTAASPSPVDIDVELVPPSELPDNPVIASPLIPSRPASAKKGKGLIVGIVVTAVLASCGCAGIAGFVARRMFG